MLLCHLSESSRHPRFNDGKDGEPCGPREYVPWDDLVQPIIAIIDERTKDLGCLFAFLRKRYCSRRMGFGIRVQVSKRTMGRQLERVVDRAHRAQAN